MMRVKDADRTIHFYRDILGMDLVRGGGTDAPRLSRLAFTARAAPPGAGDAHPWRLYKLLFRQLDAGAEGGDGGPGVGGGASGGQDAVAAGAPTQTAPDSARQRQTAPDEPQAEVLKQMCHSPCAQVLELTHNHGTEKDDAFHVHTGNSEPLGFGHIGFLKPAGRGEGLLLAGERRAYFSRLPRRRPRGDVQGDGAGVKPLPAPSLPRQSRQRRGGGGMAVTTARGVMVASEREGADGLLLPLSREPSSSRARGEGPRAALSRCSSRAQAGVPFHKRPQDGGMSSLAFALDPSGALLCGAVPARPVNSIALTRRAANRLPGRARAARRLVRRRVLQLLRSGARRVQHARGTPFRVCLGLSPSHGPAPAAHGVSDRRPTPRLRGRVFISLFSFS